MDSSRGSSDELKRTNKGRSKTNCMAKESLLKQKSPAEFFAENKNIAGFDNKRLAKEARMQEIQAKNVALGKKLKEPPAIKSGKGRGEASFFKVTCKDNGRGMPHDEIPNMFGRVLSGTKYGLKQTRGKFGLGAKMALIWSKMSTGLPIEILSATRGQNYASFCRLDIDIHQNIPHVHLHEKRENKDKWHGAEIQIIIEGNWTTYRSKILHYMRQMAVITPYSQFFFKFISGISEKNLTIRFARRTDVMPPAPLETKHHPSAVDILLIKRLIAETSKQTLQQFLQHEFVNISKSYAERLVGEMGPDFGPKMAVKNLTSHQIVRIHQLFRQAKFDDPSGDCLSPAGEYNLRLGIIKELQPDMVATCSSSPQVFEGHPFIVEAGISLGGKDVKQGLNIFRFANRIPLLFEQGADVVTRTAMKKINWSSYKINQMQDKIGVFVSIVSTKVPFKGTGKEYIGDDITEISSAVKSAIKQCCLQLRSKIVKKLQARERQERKRNLTRYIPDASRAIMEVLEEMAQNYEPKRQRYDKEDDELLNKIASKEITETTFGESLSQYVEQVDYEMALEYATQSGASEEPREPIYLSSLEGSYSYVDLHSPVFVFRLIT
ncbi:DNA topoisomerase 6 subunit B-like isoform X2 [Musa acuminata AAA Group]|uniref:DNA topoisomerase 6 subunit B-like isoform X2 n=1 Tax=Musa acuminata AAA Group TaxID=214697 RepID=UPI0031D46B7E